MIVSTPGVSYTPVPFSVHAGRIPRVIFDIMFRVAIKESAIEWNSNVADLVEGWETVREFESRQAAENLVSELSTRSCPVRLQNPAPQEPMDIDAYLVPNSQTDEYESVTSNKQGITFPVGANAYGSIGLGLIYFDGKKSPALAHYFSEEVADSEQGKVRNVVLEPGLPSDLSREVSWSPDLKIEVVQTPGRSVSTYFAEVKAGQASFQRNQFQDMQRVAEEYPVLKIRVDLEALPDEYTTRIHQVEVQSEE